MSVHSVGLLSENLASVRMLTNVFPLVLLLSCILGSYGSFFFPPGSYGSILDLSSVQFQSTILKIKFKSFIPQSKDLFRLSLALDKIQTPSFCIQVPSQSLPKLSLQLTVRLSLSQIFSFSYKSFTLPGALKQGKGDPVIRGTSMKYIIQ